jgi:prephenate dehydrogenase
MNSIQVGILGLGRVGASIGLALARYNARKEATQQFVVSAFDPRSNVLSLAQERGAAKDYARSVLDAVATKDIVIIALPYAEVQAAYRTIAPALRADVVLLDTSPLKLPSLEWANKHLPASIHMIGITPVINPRYLFDGLDDTEHASEDLFDGGAMLLSPDARANRDAVELAADFSSILGASSHFVDPAEHDGVIAATEGLPALLGVAMFSLLQRSQGWNDAQRAGNPALGQLTHHLRDSHPDDLRDLLLLNRENTARHLGDLITLLTAFQGALARNDRDGVEAFIIQAADSYDAWLGKRTSGTWDKRDEPVQGTTGAVMSGLLGGYLSRRIRGDKGK